MNGQNKIMRGSPEYQMLKERIASSVTEEPRLRDALERRLKGKPLSQKDSFFDAMLYNSCTPEEIEYRGEGGFWGNNELWGDFNYERAMAAVILSLVGYPVLEKAMKRVFGESTKVIVLADNHSCIARVEIVSPDADEKRLAEDATRALEVFAMCGLESNGTEPIVLTKDDGTMYGVAYAEKPLANMVRGGKETE